MELKGVIACYRRYLPVTDMTPIITLGDGDTPLIPAPRPTIPASLDAVAKAGGLA